MNNELKRLDIDPADVEIINPRTSSRVPDYVKDLCEARSRKGMIESEAFRWMRRRAYYGAMMVKRGDADGMVAGLTRNYSETLRPALQIVGLQPNRTVAAGVYMLVLKQKVLFFADTTVNIEPNAETVAEIALLASDAAKHFGIDSPRIALLSFSNFGSVDNMYSHKVQEAANIVRELRPDFIIDGEMQFDAATDPDVAADFPFSRIQGDANVLVFPNLSAGNIGYQIMHRFADAESIGPILLGLNKPINILQRDASVDDIFRIAALTCVQTQLLHEGESVGSVPHGIRRAGISGGI
ncbi:MAG: hypothetical protein KDH09_02360 [Chrysiogenetes bacterium]|nr:hypothetical protein [Chrysiogenetes bacterium]